MTEPDALRAHLIRLLDWQEAHAGFDKAVADLAPDKRGARASGFDHSPWQLLEHLRIAQADILDFCLNRPTCTTAPGRMITGRRIPNHPTGLRGRRRSLRIVPIATR